MKSVHDAEYRCDAAQQTHARKDSDELHLTPAAKLKVAPYVKIPAMSRYHGQMRAGRANAGRLQRRPGMV